MSIIYNTSRINPTAAADLAEVVTATAEHLNSENLGCRFLRDCYGMQVFDIDNEADMAAMMDGYGYAASARAIADNCDSGSNHALVLEGWLDGRFSRLSDSTIEYEVYTAARKDWEYFCQNIRYFLEEMENQDEIGAHLSTSILKAIGCNWAKEAVDKFSGN